MPIAVQRPWARLIFVCLLTGIILATPSWAIGPLKTVPVGNSPGPIVINSIAHEAYVVNQGDSTLSILDTEGLTVKAVVKVGAGPWAIAANPAANLVYVLNTTAASLTGIHGTKVAGTLKIGGTPIALVVDTTLNQFYVADEARNQVRVYNASKGTLLAALSTGQRPGAMAVNLAAHAVFVACTGTTGSVVVIDGTTNKILTTVGPLPTGATSISVDPVTNVAVEASPSANIYTVIDAANGYAITEEPIGDGDAPLATAFDPGLGYFFTSDSNGGLIYFADGTGLILFEDAYITDELGATALAVSVATNQMAVTYPTGQQIVIIDLLNPIDHIYNHFVNTGVTPTQLAFDPLTNRAFVTNAGDNTVSVIDITPETLAPAYEQNFENFNLGYDYIDVNPATGTAYTLRVNYLFAVNEAQAGAGSNGTGMNMAGVTTIPLASDYSETVAVNSATNKIYVGDYSGSFYSVNGATNVATLITSVPSTADIRGLAVDYASNEVVAWDYANKAILILDSSTDSLLKTIPFSSVGASSVLVDPAKNLVYAHISDLNLSN